MEVTYVVLCAKSTLAPQLPRVKPRIHTPAHLALHGLASLPLLSLSLTQATMYPLLFLKLAKPSNHLHVKSSNVNILEKLTGTPLSSVQFSFSLMSDSATHGLKHTRPLCPSPTPRVHPNPCPLSQWSFPKSGSFPMSQLSASGGQSIGVSASTSVLPVKTQDWSHLGWTGWISLKSKGSSRVSSNTTVQKHQFFGAQLSL